LVGSGKPAKLLRGEPKALIGHAFREPSNIGPSNMPAPRPGKRRKTAIPALGRGSGRAGPTALDRRRQADVAGGAQPGRLDGRGAAQGAIAGPKVSPRTPSDGPQIGISGRYFIPRAAQAVRGVAERLLAFPRSRRRGPRKRPQKRANLF